MRRALLRMPLYDYYCGFALAGACFCLMACSSTCVLTGAQRCISFGAECNLCCQYQPMPATMCSVLAQLGVLSVLMSILSSSSWQFSGRPAQRTVTVSTPLFGRPLIMLARECEAVHPQCTVILKDLASMSLLCAAACCPLPFLWHLCRETLFLGSQYCMPAAIRPGRKCLFNKLILMEAGSAHL